MVHSIKISNGKKSKSSKDIANIKRCIMRKKAMIELLKSEISVYKIRIKERK